MLLAEFVRLLGTLVGACFTSVHAFVISLMLKVIATASQPWNIRSPRKVSMVLWLMIRYSIGIWKLVDWLLVSRTMMTGRYRFSIYVRSRASARGHRISVMAKADGDQVKVMMILYTQWRAYDKWQEFCVRISGHMFWCPLFRNLEEICAFAHAALLFRLPCYAIIG